MIKLVNFIYYYKEKSMPNFFSNFFELKLKFKI